MTPPLSMYFKEGNVTHISLIGQLHHRSSKDNPKATIRILKTSASDKQFSFTWYQINNFLLTNWRISSHLAPVARNNLPVCKDVHIHTGFATEAVRGIIIVHRIYLRLWFVKILLAHVTVICKHKNTDTHNLFLPAHGQQTIYGPQGFWGESPWKFLLNSDFSGPHFMFSFTFSTKVPLLRCLLIQQFHTSLISLHKCWKLFCEYLIKSRDPSTDKNT